MFGFHSKPIRKVKYKPRLLIKKLNQLAYYFSLFASVLIFIDLGFEQGENIQQLIGNIYIGLLFFESSIILIRYIVRQTRPLFKVWLADLLLIIIMGTSLLAFFEQIIVEQNVFDVLLHFTVFSILVREFSMQELRIEGKYLNPARLFVLSFLSIIILGTVLLMLPNATYTEISFIDAFFTATSAVCVTGLIVVDTGSHFTIFGQVIIMTLIQVGGIGIMTFASYFSYFFRGGSSYKNQLLLRDMSNTDKLTEVFSTLKKIILITLFIELIGVIFIYASLDRTLIPATSERLFFSIFHAISGFCNAGFSTLPNSLYEVGFRFNYPLHITISLLFILGGIGFPILFNFLKYLKHLIINRLLPFSMSKAQHRVPWVINLNTRLVVLTSLVLIVGGTLLFFISEYNNTLQEHKGLGKLVTAFFGAVTTRTAGFNTVDTGALNISTIMVVIFLMWVGASPASTGGGIKTSTLAIGFLNIINLAKGNSRIEIYCRQVAAISIQRAYAIMMLSVIVIGVAVLLVSLFDPGLPIRSVVFECFSAYSTVGLSMGITADLSSLSKVVIVLTMFIGRVSMLSILIAIFRNINDLKYTYPTEEILIN